MASLRNGSPVTTPNGASRKLSPIPNGDCSAFRRTKCVSMCSGVWSSKKNSRMSPKPCALAHRAHTFLTYRKDLNNLRVQEGRLLRLRENTINALEEMQEERRKRINAQITSAATALQEHRRAGKPFDFTEFGSKFQSSRSRPVFWIGSPRVSATPLVRFLLGSSSSDMNLATAKKLLKNLRGVATYRPRLAVLFLRK